MDIVKGTNLYNRVKNKMGFVLDATNKKSISVRTVSGDDVWNLDDCDVMDD